MSDWGYVALAWGAAVGVLVPYALWVALRGRSVSRRLPAEERRWM